MEDRTEGIRRALVTVVNRDPEEREDFEKEYGSNDVFNTEEATEKFEFLNFMAPFVIVRRNKDGVKGILMFQDRPRYYFNFQES